MAEWLRCWTANPMGSALVSSYLILVEKIEVKKMYGFFRSHKFALLYYQLKLSLFSSEIGMWYELERLKIDWTLSITWLIPHEQLNF